MAGFVHTPVLVLESLLSVHPIGTTTGPIPTPTPIPIPAVTPPPSVSKIYKTPTSRWTALTTRNSQASDAFVYGVLTTKIYCRPDCKARLARRANVVFYDTPAQAERAGFRACKRCRPQRGSKRAAPKRVSGHATAVEGTAHATTGSFSSGASKQAVSEARSRSSPTCSPGNPFKRYNGSIDESETNGSSRHAMALQIDDHDHDHDHDPINGNHEGYLNRPDCGTKRRPTGNVLNNVQNMQMDAEADADADADADAGSDSDTDGTHTKIQRAVHLVRQTALENRTTLSLSQLAREVGLSKWHLQRVFKRLQGVTPREMAERIISMDTNANTTPRDNNIFGTGGRPNSTDDPDPLGTAALDNDTDAFGTGAPTNTGDSNTHTFGIAAPPDIGRTIIRAHHKVLADCGGGGAAMPSGSFPTTTPMSCAEGEAELRREERDGGAEELTPCWAESDYLQQPFVMAQHTPSLGMDLEMALDPGLTMDPMDVALDTDVTDLLGDLFPELHQGNTVGWPCI